MSSEKKDSFPILPVRQWWALRSRFQGTIPGIVTATYIASALSIKEVSARNNIIPYLRQAGIIDESSKPTDRAKEWRDDSLYPTVCKNIINEIYPEELRAACQKPTTDRDCVERWFAHRTGSGKSAVQKMAAFYIMLCEADISKAVAGVSAKKAGAKTTQRRAAPKRAEGAALQTEKKVQEDKEGTTPDSPSIHINLEVHISSDASEDQIDKIFESMAKHIYKKKS